MPLVLRGWRKALLSINNHVYNPAGVLQGSTKSASKHLQAETALELKTTLHSAQGGSSNSCMLLFDKSGAANFIHQERSDVSSQDRRCHITLVVGCSPLQVDSSGSRDKCMHQTHRRLL